MLFISSNFGQLQPIIQTIITLACSVRYMPYTTRHVYIILKIENTALEHICDTAIPLSPMTLDNYSKSIVLILTKNMSTIVIVTAFQIGNAYVALPTNFSMTKIIRGSIRA